MESLFSQIPKNLPAWAWIMLFGIGCITVYLIAKASSGSKRQSNSISKTSIKNTKVKQENIDKSKDL